jgi:hypothetical protein
MPTARILLAVALLASGVLTGVAVAGRPEPARAAAVHPKRGIASSRFLGRDPRVLGRLHASWAYDWSSMPPPGRRGPQWVPMLWGAGSVTRGTLASLHAAHNSGRARDLLGFNEPDSAGQANMTPDRAAALWPRLVRTGLRLGSPAPAVPGDGWLDRFMALTRARHLRVDFIALHFYQDFTNPNAVRDLRRQLADIHRRYGKPIWITEIGALDIRRWGEPMLRTPTVTRATSYMRKLFGVLDALPYVTRYAWFTDTCSGDDCRYSALLTAAGRPTAVGSAFLDAP